MKVLKQNEERMVMMFYIYNLHIVVLGRTGYRHWEGHNRLIELYINYPKVVCVLFILHNMIVFLFVQVKKKTSNQ